MNGDERAFGRQSSVLLAVVSLSMLLLLGGCSDLRQAFGMDQAGPDEFAVETQAPLTIPPDFDLRPPRPGAPRPHQLSAAERAQRVIDTAGPGKPGDQAVAALRPNQVGTIGAQSDRSGAVAPNSLASKLLGASDSAAGGTVASRKTATLKGVY